MRPVIVRYLGTLDGRLPPGVCWLRAQFR